MMIKSEKFAKLLFFPQKLRLSNDHIYFVDTHLKFHSSLVISIVCIFEMKSIVTKILFFSYIIVARNSI